ncbi:MAG: hypothetical protein ABSG63_10950 [Spirochaetia bacterium]|jgi:hypothetical protein
MDHNGRGKGSEETVHAGVVILSAACWNPSMGGLDEQARRVVETAASETGVEVQVSLQPMSAALYGGVPKEVVAQLKIDSQAGGLRMPVVMINGKAVSYGAPDAGRITAALRELAGTKPAKK